MSSQIRVPKIRTFSPFSSFLHAQLPWPPSTFCPGEQPPTTSPPSSIPTSTTLSSTSWPSRLLPISSTASAQPPPWLSGHQRIASITNSSSAKDNELEVNDKVHEQASMAWFKRYWVRQRWEQTNWLWRMFSIGLFVRVCIVDVCIGHLLIDQEQWPDSNTTEFVLWSTTMHNLFSVSSVVALWMCHWSAAMPQFSLQ